MTTEYSVSVSDWSDPKWRFTGRDLEEKMLEEGTEDNENGFDGDDYHPVMLYAYPLYDCPSDEKILKIHNETALTVVEDTSEGEYYLALCGGGMDLSQDVGMAYLIAQGWIPHALIRHISTQPNLSQSGKNFRMLMRKCRNCLKQEIRESRVDLVKMGEAIKKSLEYDRKKREAEVKL